MPHPYESTGSYWDNYSQADHAAAVGAAIDIEHSRQIHPFTAIQRAAQETFGNAVFQQPEKTLAIAGGQITAGISLMFTGQAAYPHVVTGVRAAASYTLNFGRQVYIHSANPVIRDSAIEAASAMANINGSLPMTHGAISSAVVSGANWVKDLNN